MQSRYVTVIGTVARSIRDRCAIVKRMVTPAVPNSLLLVRTPLVARSKLRESMILRPWLRYRLVVYFSISYVRYTRRVSACDTGLQRAGGESGGGPESASGIEASSWRAADLEGDPGNAFE